MHTLPRSSMFVTKSPIGRVLNIVVGTVAGMAAVLFSCSYWVNSHKLAASPSLHAPSNPTRTARAELAAVGLSPDVLCAAGLTSQQAASVVGNAMAHLAEHGEDLALAIAAHTTAKAEVERLERVTVLGMASQQEAADLAAARQSLVGATSAMTSARAALFDAATQGLSASTKALIQRFHAHRGRDVHMKYLGADRSEAEWRALREALANVSIAARRNEAVDSVSASIVAAEDSTEETIRASASLLNLEDVRASWRSATSIGN